ncbi:MAG: hypothetical protein L0H78_02085 [Humibacillus sp.]|nr:hypothetical protein [Humibacillus sp.]
MTAQAPLPVVPHPDAVLIGAAAALVEDTDGGRVFVRGELVMAWQPGDHACRRLAAVQLVTIKAARAFEVAAGFGVDPDTLRRWGQAMDVAGAGGLVPAKTGPKGPSALTPAVVARIRARRTAGASLRAIAAAVGVSTDSVRRALPATPVQAMDDTTQSDTTMDESIDEAVEESAQEALGEVARADINTPMLPVLAQPVDRSAERVAARFGLIEHAAPVFTPAGRVPLAGLLLALPALEATGLLACAGRVYGALPNGFYGLHTVLLEAVLRTLAGQPRAEGATRIDPTALGRVLGMDRAPEVKTIRRKLGLLAAAGHADRLIAAMAATHLARPTGSDGSGGDGEAGSVGIVLYVDGHVRAYQGGRKVGKTHLARLRFPAPATLETWVSDAAGDPVLVVMAQPGASLAGELRRLMPQLRAAVGDNRRVLVGFDRGGWSPALFKHLDEAGFDVLTWRKGPTPDIDPDQFTDLDFTDETGLTHAWRVADTTTTLPLSQTENATEGATRDTAQGEPQVFTMRQITLAVPVTKHSKKHTTENGTEDGGGLRQIHILTTRTDLPPAEIIYRMGSRWRQENYFRYARMHFDLDSHDSYTVTDDDPDRSVPNPARKRTYQQVLAARVCHQQQTAAADAALLAARSPAPGTPTLLTNAAHDALTADLRTAEAALTTAEAAHAATPARLPLREVNPGQQVLDVQTKLLTHAIRIAAFNTATTLARELRLHTRYARKNDEAHTLIRHVLTASGDIDPTTEGVLTIRLDPLPTRRATTAIKELCEHLTATETRYPGTDLTLRYEIKTAP